MKAKPTRYCGIQFRSKTEAKYAFLFNFFDEPWKYEPEYFKLSRNYLPDFFLPNLDSWLEVKGKQPTKEEIQLCEELSKATNKSVLLGHNWPPKLWFYQEHWHYRCAFTIIDNKLHLSTYPYKIVSPDYDAISEEFAPKHRYLKGRRNVNNRSKRSKPKGN